MDSFAPQRGPLAIKAWEQGHGMGRHTPFDTFTQSAFGIEPGGLLGSRLEAMATTLSLPRGRVAPIDRSLDQVVYVVSGATKLAAEVSSDREQIVAFHFAGDVVSIPADGIHSYLLTALVETEMLVFPAREFFDRAAGDWAMARSLLERLPAALHRCRDKAVALGRKSAGERLAGFLLAMAERIGRSDQGSCILDLPMSRRDVADSLGLTIETVSRQLGILREMGLIETQGRSRIALHDLAALAAAAGRRPDPQKTRVSIPEFDLDQCGDAPTRLIRQATGGK